MRIYIRCIYIVNVDYTKTYASPFNNLQKLHLTYKNIKNQVYMLF